MIRGRIVPGSAPGEALGQAFSIREDVFVKEQGYALEIERDSYDETAAHALVWDDDTPLGTGRLYLDDEAEWHIGRVAVRKQARGRGIGDLIMRMLLQSALGFGAETVYLGSQEHAVGFYEKLGFQVYGGVYLDEGQPHYHMMIQQPAMLRLFQGCEGCAGCGGDCPAASLE